MPTHIKISGAASALLALAALLAAGARAETVTTPECQGHDNGTYWERIRQYPTDSNVIMLSMEGCSLHQIDPTALAGLPNLIIVGLEENNIESINPAVFHTAPALTTLWLGYNKLRELPVFDERSCANLTWLTLNNNKLTVIDNADTFAACTKLERLILNDNRIEFVHPNLLSTLINLNEIYLNNNRIRFVPDQLFFHNNKLVSVMLYNNSITHLPPDFASSLKRAGAGLEDFYFYGNPWHCACFLELLADVQRAGVTNYNYWDGKFLYKGALPECNYIGMFPCRRDAPSGLLQLAPRAAQGGH